MDDDSSSTAASSPPKDGGGDHTGDTTMDQQSSDDRGAAAPDAATGATTASASASASADGDVDADANGGAGDGGRSPPRLMITKMVLENFKSYAGVKEIGPFHKCFSSVVGPNGSGKSNVIDAMLFVFGKRAKKLRLNKVSELIHSSDAYRDHPLQYARVSVHFQEIVDTGDGDGDYEVVPDSDIVVSRTARRDNSSSYRLNGKNVAFRGVADYLDSKGIDLNNNRFLILQGEVEMISMMAPKGKTEDDEGLLEYLEDIIGSNKFVEETNVAAARVEALTEQRQERLNRVKAVEKEKENLEGAKLEAEALLGKEREIRRKKNVLYQMNAMDIRKDLDDATEKREAAMEQLEAERLQLKAADDRVKEIEAGLAAKSKEYDKVSKSLRKAKEEFATYERQDIELRENIKHGKATKKKLQTKVKTETKKISDLTSKAEKADGSIPNLEERIEELTEAKATEDEKLEKIYDEMKGVTEKLRHDLEGKTQELAPVQQERAVFQGALDTAATELKLLEDSTTRAKEQLDAAEVELASLDQKQSSLRTDLSKCEDELAESEQRLEDAKKEDVVLAEKEKGLARQNTELLGRAEEAKAAFQAGSSRSQAVKGILRHARKGGELANAGVLGRLGDLASISDEYDVAVSTACGMLDYIVVKSTAGAQQCLQFLRKHGLGRANFIPLDKMKKGAHDRAVETPENAPRLFDLIALKNFALAPAMYLAVGNTLVASDLETATRWAYDYGRRWRVVTTDGKLIETSGTMAGGGKSVRKGGMRLSKSKNPASAVVSSVGDVSEEDCALLEVQAKKALDALQECRASRRSLAEEIRALTRRVKTLSVKIPKLSMEIEGCDTTREELTNRLPDLRKQSTLSSEDETKQKDLQGKVEKCKSDMASCALLASKLEAEVAKIQKAILDAGGTKLKKQQNACEKALASLNEANKLLNTTKVTVASSRKAITKAEKALKAAEKELEECIEKYESNVNELKTLEDKAYVVHQAYEREMEAERAQKEELDSFVKECDDLKGSQSKIKCTEVQLLGQVDQYEKLMKDSLKRQHHWEAELSKLRASEEQDDDYDVSDNEEEDDSDDETSDGMKNGDDVEMKESEDGQGDENNGIGQSSKRKRAKASSLPDLPNDALEQYSREEVKHSIGVLEGERDTLAKNSNMGAIAEYRKKEADYLARVVELDEITESRNDARKAHEELRRKRLEMFMDGFGRITLKLKEMYQMITLGGDAELELVDSLDPFSEGIVFSVRPPKKSWKNIANLSGGEKTLSSLALVFALHHYRPTPLYVMDEIDAALDFKNVSIVAHYIKDRTKNAQFIIISLRNNMFELADRLVGIYKTNNCTKSVTINPRAFGKHTKNGQGSAEAAPALADRTNKLGNEGIPLASSSSKVTKAVAAV